MSQVTDTVLMVRPASFRKNEETAVNNYFQEDLALENEAINAQAQQEFDAFVTKLKAAGIHVLVLQDERELNTPDSIFPNNWVSTHKNGAPEFKRGYKWLHAQHILQADKGCDFDFLRAESLQNG